MAGVVGAAPDLSLFALFWQADWIVKAVMLSLAVASIWCWAIIFSKATSMMRLRRVAAAFEADFWSGISLEDLYTRVRTEATDPMALMFIAAMEEWKKSATREMRTTNALRERLHRVMTATLSREMARLERHVSFLGSVASVAPFVGLFGTVWGIMNSFASIAASKQTNLAVVAPGIAEALFATALGLVAAIPATIAYNKFIGDFGAYAERLELFAGDFEVLVSRRLDRAG